MKVLGIIAEYNPFHKGHAYQIKTLKEKVQADYVVAAMSGNFVQRGAPALMEKYSRAQMALRCGIDLVLELPTPYATASAEYFARGGVALLEGTGIVTHLGFGIEASHFGTLQELADILTQQPELFQHTLQQGLKQGLSFPAARFQAITACLGQRGAFPLDALRQILGSPNNILAVEYLKALSRCRSKMVPCPLQRQGQPYHGTALGQEYPSASAIRAAILNPDSHMLREGLQDPPRLAALKGAMPEAAYSILEGYPHPFLQEDDFSPLLHYKLLTEPASQLSLYADVSPDFARRMGKEASRFLSWSQFCSHLKCKNITYTRLSRMFLHIVLSLYAENQQNCPEPAYLRVLGFCKEAAPLLTAIKFKGKLPAVTSPSAINALTDSARRRLADDIKASGLYRVGLSSKGDSQLKNDYQQPMLRL